MTRRKLAIMIDWFLPGYKAGGQIRSCANLAQALQDVFDVYIITTDRDLGDQQAYSHVQPDEWNALGDRLKVFYISPTNLRYATIRDIIHQLQPHCIYLNSMFSWNFTVIPLLISRSYPAIRVIIAPRGMLHAGALQYKPLKKKIFLTAFKMAGLPKRIFFQATDNTEQQDIRKAFGAMAKIRLVQDFNASAQPPFQILQKDVGELKCLFVSRIAQKKNLLYILSLLPQVSGRILFSIAGPVEEEPYWNECRQVISSLPANISVNHLGAVPHKELEKIYLDHHLFILPTFGENFGHVIFESLLNGRPVLISDQTPWQDLQQKQAGWAFGLGQKDAFLQAIITACGWNQQAFDMHAAAAWQYASDYIQKADLRSKYVDLFQGEPTPTPPRRG